VRSAARLLLAVAVMATGPACGHDHPATTGLSRLLALLPDTAETRSLAVVNDYAAARAAGGLPIPAAGSQAAEYRLAITTRRDPGLFTSPAPISGGATDADDLWRQELGFTFGDVDGDARAGAGDQLLQAVTGRIFPAAVATAVHGDPPWSDHLHTTTRHGTPVYAWDDAAPNPADAVRPDGVGGRVAVEHDGTVAFAPTAGGIDALVDATAGRAGSLAAVPALADLATALDAAGAHAAAFSTDTGQFARDNAVPDDLPPEVAATVAAQTLLRPYDAVATGVARRNGKTELIVVVLNPDKATAATNATRLRAIVEKGSSFAAKRPWHDLLTVAAITTSGRVVTARLTTNVGSLWLDVILGGDSLLWWS
jgi:hypothetical protein